MTGGLVWWLMVGWWGQPGGRNERALLLLRVLEILRGLTVLKVSKAGGIDTGVLLHQTGGVSAGNIKVQSIYSVVQVLRFG